MAKLPWLEIGARAAGYAKVLAGDPARRGDELVEGHGLDLPGTPVRRWCR